MIVISNTFVTYSGRGSSEEVGQWTRAEGEKGPSPFMGCGISPRKIVENIGANLCNLVHFWPPVQQKVYTSVFNFDFRRSI